MFYYELKIPHTLHQSAGALRLVGRFLSVLQLHPRALQREHVGGIQPVERRRPPGDQPQDRLDRGDARGAVRLPPPDPRLLRGRQPRPRPASPPAALEGQRQQHPSHRIPPEGGLLLRHDAEEQVLPLPERLRGGEPAHRRGGVSRVRARDYQRQLLFAVQRCPQLEVVLGAGFGRRHPEPEEDSYGHLAAAVYKDAEEGEGGAEALHGE